jgi:hypothetical protein
MKRSIEVILVLEYYDVPQIFVGIDKVSTYFLCTLIDDSEEYKYVAIQVSPSRLLQYINKTVDLRNLYEEPEIKNYYMVTCPDNKFVAEDCDMDRLPERMMPDKGFFYSETVHNAIPAVNGYIEIGGEVHRINSKKDIEDVLVMVG